MAFLDEKEQLYLEKDALGGSLGVSLLQQRNGMQFPTNVAPTNRAPWPIAFASKSLTSAETQYRNIKREVLGILHVFKHSTTAALSIR